MAWRLLVSAACVTQVAAGASELLQEAQGLQPWLQGARRHLHTVPELAFDLPKTTAYIRAQLEEMGVAPEVGAARTGIVGVVGRGEPAVALRADMDALPVQEDSGVEYASTHPGQMHACGHDAHMAMLLGAAKLLKRREDSLPGSVRLLFQPDEEMGGGALKMVQEGALGPAGAVHGLHVFPDIASGVIASKAGTVMAAEDSFAATVKGRGGHGAMPHLTRDPVVAAALAVAALQPLVSRETAPTQAAVVTVARFSTGEGAHNVIPEKVQLGGTIRAVTHAGLEGLRQRVTEVIEGTAKLHGCSANLTWAEQPYPPTVNAAALVDSVEGVVGELAGPHAFHRLPEPTMAAEDFSYFADAVPGVFSFVGVRNESAGATHGLHTPQFRMDDSVLPLGAAVHAAFALHYLHAQQGPGGQEAAGEEL